MKTAQKKIIAIMLTIIMLFSFSACSAEVFDGYINFFLHGWDGEYVEKEKSEREFVRQHKVHVSFDRERNEYVDDGSHLANTDE